MNVDTLDVAQETLHAAPARIENPPNVPRVTIAMLPDVALLVIFDFYSHNHDIWERQTWDKLVHVCRKWRNVVFGSPGRLDLRLYCTNRTPVLKTLDVWPSLPIVIDIDDLRGTPDTDNIIAALKQNDRICQLKISLLKLSLISKEKVFATMQQPFPALTLLELKHGDGIAPVDANSFLGGPAPPHLQSLSFIGIAIPGLPKSLLSATHLVRLSLSRIPHSGYFSPEAMVTCLSVLTRLERLVIGFKSPRSRPDRRHPPPRMRTILPVLTELYLNGVSEYLEDFLARIDAPLLDKLNISLFHQLVFDTPQLALFISRTPKFQAHDKLEARVHFPSFVNVSFSTLDGRLNLTILCGKSDWQLSCLAQVCSSSFPQALISTVEHLYIQEYREGVMIFSSDHHNIDDVESSQWLELLRPFTAVKHLYITPKSTPGIATALQGLVVETVAEVLPVLETFFLETLPSEPIQEAIEKFAAARQLFSHSITISRCGREGFR